MTGLIGGPERRQLQANLSSSPPCTGGRAYLVGDQLTLADLAVVAQLSLLLFPASAGAPLAGRGVSGLADHPLLAAAVQLARWHPAPAGSGLSGTAPGTMRPASCCCAWAASPAAGDP